MKKREIGTILLIALIGAILLFPLFGLIFEYLVIDPRKGLRLFWMTLADPAFLSALRFTLWQASLSVIGSLLLGIPAAWLLAKHRIPGKGLIYALLTIPMMLPVIMAVLSFVILYGENGLLNEFLRFLGKAAGIEFPRLELLYSMRGIVLCHLFYNAPIVAKIVGRAWERLGIAEEEAAVTLGASPWRCWWSVTLPKLTPAILSAAAITFVFCFTSFAIPLILGGKPSLATLEVLIFEQARLFLNLPRAIALSLIELSIATLFFFLSSRAYERADIDLLPSRMASRLPADQLSAVRFVSLIVIALFFSMLVFSPLAAMLISALREMM
ncbi:MAG: iron ABC transporter permease, partial [Deltaproteobacteria bacterium]|nr:iron ABC transporter permease [Deltaproteobacteria bacterium]